MEDDAENKSEEGWKPAEFSFSNALAVEDVHSDLFAKARKAVESGHDLPDTAIYVCPVCHIAGEKYRIIE